MRLFRWLWRWGAAPPPDFGAAVAVRGVWGPVAVRAVYGTAAQIRGVK